MDRSTKTAANKKQTRPFSSKASFGKLPGSGRGTEIEPTQSHNAPRKRKHDRQDMNSTSECLLLEISKGSVAEGRERTSNLSSTERRRANFSGGTEAEIIGATKTKKMIGAKRATSRAVAKTANCSDALERELALLRAGASGNRGTAKTRAGSPLHILSSKLEKGSKKSRVPSGIASPGSTEEEKSLLSKTSGSPLKDSRLGSTKAKIMQKNSKLGGVAIPSRSSTHKRV